jgi:hypothetical protein
VPEAVSAFVGGDAFGGLVPVGSRLGVRTADVGGLDGNHLLAEQVTEGTASCCAHSG